MMISTVNAVATWEIFDFGKFWQISYSQCIWQICFPCIYEYWWGKFWQMAHELLTLPIFPTKIFPCTVLDELDYFIVYSIVSIVYAGWPNTPEACY